MDTTATSSSPTPVSSTGALKAAERTQEELATKLIQSTEATDQAQRSAQVQQVERQRRSDEVTISPEAKAMLAKEIGG